MKIKLAKKTTDEDIVSFKTSELMKKKHNLMPNLRWLIPMAMYDTPVVPVEFNLNDLPLDWRFGI